MKRIISFLAAAALVFGTGAALPEGAVGLDAAISASALTYGDFEYTVLEDGTVEISGYSGSDAYLNVPAKIENKAVTVIGEYAFATGPFMGNENIVNVTLPDSITNISVASFAYCPNLESVNIPENVTVISERAFWGCKSLKGITIPNSVTVIGGWAFCSCIGFSSVVIPRSVESISENAIGYTGGSDKVDGFTIYGYSGTVAESYANNCGFEFIDLGKEYTYGDWVYTLLADGTIEIAKYQGSDTIVTVPAEIDGKKVTRIGEHAFDYCIDITDVTIPEGVTSIGDWAFSECYKLKNIDLPDSLKSIGEMAFQLCGFESLAIPNNVTSIGKDAFWNCYNLNNVMLPDNLVSIGDGAFGNCVKLESIEIPIYVESIGKEAFWNCESITKVTIPRIVSTINEKAFGYIYENNAGESKLDGFTIYGYSGTAAETYANNDGFEFVDLGKEYTYGDWVYTLLADGTIEIAKYQGSDTIVTVPAKIDGKKVTSIGAAFAVWNCQAEITEVKLPSGLKKIGAQAFSNRTTLEKVNIPDSVESIGNSAFWCCTKLKAITLPDSVTSLDAGAFSGCEALESITLSENITSLNTFGFDASYYGVLSGCSKLKSVVIPKKVTVIDDYAIGYSMVNLFDKTNPQVAKVDGFTIYGYSGTAAEEYANKNGFTFIPLDAEPGDADGNGDVTVDDVLLIQQKIAGWDVKVNEAAADLDGDGKLTVSDALIVQQIIAGWKIVI